MVEGFSFYAVAEIITTSDNSNKESHRFFDKYLNEHTMRLVRIQKISIKKITIILVKKGYEIPAIQVG